MNPFKFKRSSSHEPNLEEDKVKYRGVWKVSAINGSANQCQNYPESCCSGEIALVRSDFSHGFKSFGWDGPMKIILSESDSFDREKNRYAKLIWERTLKFANELAAELNGLEK